MIQHLDTKGTPKGGLIGATLGFFIGFAAVSLFGPTASYLQRVTALSPALAGLLVSIPNLSGSLLRIPFSAMVDKDGGRKPFTILLLVSLVGLIGLSTLLSMEESVMARLFPLMLLLGVFGGAGIATFSVGISQTAYWFPQSRQGVALGVYAGIGNLAPGIFALILTGVTIPALGIARSYWIWTAALALGLLVYLLLGRNAWYFQLRKRGATPEEARSAAAEKGQEVFPKGSALETLKIAAANGKTWGLVFVYFTTFGGFMALTAWLPKYWQGYFGLALGLAGSATFAYATVASLTRVAGGFVSDRFGGYNTAYASLVLVLLCAALLVFASHPLLAFVFLILMGTGMGVANAAVFKLVAQEIPHAVGGAAGWVGGLGAFGGFVIPNLMAIFLTTGSDGDPGFAWGFTVFVLFALLGIGALYLVRRGTRREASEVTVTQ